MAQKCLLFAYGMLMPHVRPPRSLSRSWPDRVKAQMYDLGPYPAAVGVGQGNEHIEGFTLEIDVDELPGLDEFEDVEGGDYRRIQVETERGYTVWIYEYLLRLPAAAPRIKTWCANPSEQK